MRGDEIQYRGCVQERSATALLDVTDVSFFTLSPEGSINVTESSSGDTLIFLRPRPAPSWVFLLNKDEEEQEKVVFSSSLQKSVM